MLELWIRSLRKVKLWDLEIQQDHGHTSRHPITLVFAYLIQILPPRKDSRRTQAGYPPTTPSPPWRTSSKVHQRRSSQRFEIRLMGNMFVVSTNDGTVKTPKKKAIWIVDFQWIGRKAVNVSIVSIDNQRNHCLANLILNGQVQRENCPFLLHKSTLPFRVEGMKGWKSWTVLENHLAMATKRPAEWPCLIIIHFHSCFPSLCDRVSGLIPPSMEIQFVDLDHLPGEEGTPWYVSAMDLWSLCDVIAVWLPLISAAIKDWAWQHDHKSAWSCTSMLANTTIYKLCTS